MERRERIKGMRARHATYQEISTALGVSSSTIVQEAAIIHRGIAEQVTATDVTQLAGLLTNASIQRQRVMWNQLAALGPDELLRRAVELMGADVVAGVVGADVVAGIVGTDAGIAPHQPAAPKARVAPGSVPASLRDDGRDG